VDELQAKAFLDSFGIVMSGSAFQGRETLPRQTNEFIITENCSASAANLVEDLLVFFAVKAAQREPAKNIHSVSFS
jgi:hypothetical protein